MGPNLLYLIAIQYQFTKFHLCPASHYCVFLSLFQLPRNRYAEHQILMYKSIIANNFGVYINSQQKDQYHSLLLQFAARQQKIEIAVTF